MDERWLIDDEWMVDTAGWRMDIWMERLYEYLEATHEYHKEGGGYSCEKRGERNLVSITIFVLFVFSVTMRPMFISTLDQDSCRLEVWMWGV